MNKLSLSIVTCISITLLTWCTSTSPTPTPEALPTPAIINDVPLAPAATGDTLQPWSLWLTGTVNSWGVTSIPMSSQTYTLQISPTSGLLSIVLQEGEIVLIKIKQPDEQHVFTIGQITYPDQHTTGPYGAIIEFKAEQWWTYEFVILENPDLNKAILPYTGQVMVDVLKPIR